MFNFAHQGRLRPLELVSVAQELPLLALSAVDRDQFRGLVTGDGGLDPRRELRRNRPGQGESGQVEVTVGGDLSTGFQRRHLAIAGIEQPGLVQHGADAAIQGEIQRVVGGVAGSDVAGQVQPTRLGDGGHELELGEVGAVVLTVPELHQAVLGDGVIATTGGGVEPDPLDGQGVDVTVGVPEIGFQGFPGRRGIEAFQEQGQAVVAKLDGADWLADEGFEGVLKIPGPGLDGRLAVVGS